MLVDSESLASSKGNPHALSTGKIESTHLVREVPLKLILICIAIESHQFLSYSDSQKSKEKTLTPLTRGDSDGDDVTHQSVTAATANGPERLLIVIQFQSYYSFIHHGLVSPR
jgi:hypothetical protein